MRCLGIVLGLCLVVGGCETSSSLERVAEVRGSNILSETCMPAVRQVDSAEMPELTQFIEEIASGLFSCEYFIGRPLRYFGSGGPKLKIRGRTLHAGAGYAIAETKAGTSSASDIGQVGKYYTLPKGFSIRAESGGILVGGQHTSTHFLYAQGPYVPERMIAALSFADFKWQGRTYRTYLWAQDFPLTKQEIASRFEYLKSLVIEVPPELLVSR